MSMKVSDLLSGPTISSSRALTFYAASINAVIFTNTKPTELPGLGNLNASDFTLYAIMLAVLGFMTLAHVVNWQTDVTGEKAAQIIKAYEETVEEKRTEMKLRTNAREKALQDHLDKVTVAPDMMGLADQTIKKAKNLSQTVRIVFHMSIPLTLSVFAWFALMSRLGQNW